MHVYARFPASQTAQALEGRLSVIKAALQSHAPGATDDDDDRLVSSFYISGPLEGVCRVCDVDKCVCWESIGDIFVLSISKVHIHPDIEYTTPSHMQPRGAGSRFLQSLGLVHGDRGAERHHLRRHGEPAALQVRRMVVCGSNPKPSTPTLIDFPCIPTGTGTPPHPPTWSTSSYWPALPSATRPSPTPTRPTRLRSWTAPHSMPRSCPCWGGKGVRGQRRTRRSALMCVMIDIV